MTSCARIPKVFNNKGEKVDSRLFLDLLSYLDNDRARAVQIYKITKSQEFIQNWNPRLTLDSNNEPTIRSLIKSTNLNTFIEDSRVLEKLNKDIGRYKPGTREVSFKKKTPESFDSTVNKAIEFNNNSEFNDEYVALPESSYNEEASESTVSIKVEKKTKDNSREAKKMEFNKSLNDRLRAILASKGISIGVLTELEEKLGVNGVTDFDKAKAAAEGLVELIRLADGIRGEKALPEEFAHVAIEALGSSNPLINRLLNLISAKGLAKEIIGEDYEEYARLYKNDEYKLAKEAAGKLLAKHLLLQEPIKATPYKSLLERVIEAIKEFFRGLSANEIQRAMAEANKGFGTVAKDMLYGDLSNSINIKNISSSELFYNTENRVQRIKKLLQNIINNELKRFKVYESRNPESRFNAEQQAFIAELERNLELDTEAEGVCVFIEKALSTLKAIDIRLKDIAVDSGMPINEKAKILRDVRNYLYSYSHILDDIRHVLIEEERETDNKFGDTFRPLFRDTYDLLRDLYDNYNEVAMPLFVQFIKPFIGENIVIPFGKFKGKIITAEELVKKAERDISFFDRWLDSMADSQSFILNIMDRAVKDSKENGRLRVIEIIRDIKAAAIKLEQAGIKDTEWMFEIDSNENKTGRYIQDINYGNFYLALDKKIKELNEKYGEHPTGEDARAYSREKSKWFDDNMETIGGKKVPKKSIYENKIFKNLSDPQKVYYNTIMNIKERLDSFLPPNYTNLFNTVKIRKDLIERIKASNDPASAAKQLWENIKDQFIRRSDDTDLGDKAALKDFEGREVQMLPIYYTKLKEGESNNDVSTDVTSTLSAYAAMAIDFDEMNKIIDILETGRSVLRDNLEIEKTSGNRGLKERFSTLGRTVESKVLKQKDDRRIIQRLDDFFEMQVYGRYIADEGTWGKLDIAKTADFINRMTSLNTLALNILSGISNVATGKVMMRIESISKEFFSEGDTLRADKNYAAAMPEFLAEIGNRVKTSKMALWSELFNVMQEYETDVKEINFDRKTWFSRMFGTSTLFFTQHAGEHWMQHRTSLALANRYKMRAPKNPDGTPGKLVSLWDAMEVKYIDPNNKKLGAKLVVKEGYTKEDGSEFTKEDIIRFSRKVAAINFKMHGIYNKLDRNAFQRVAIGRMGMIFRKWMRPSYQRRFANVNYNFDLEEWTEGYYRTSYRFLKQLGKELKEGQFTILTSFHNLDKREQANIRRALTEVAHFLLITAVLGMVEWKDKEGYWWKMLEYQLRRLYTEVGVMTPNPMMIQEALRIIKSPAAGVNTAERALDLIKLMNPYNYEWFNGEEALLKSGRYKGESRAVKLFFESPIVPMSKTVYRGLHPEEGIPFFK